MLSSKHYFLGRGISGTSESLIFHSLQRNFSINADVIITDSSDSRSHGAGQWLGIYWVSFPDCTHCITVTGWIFDSAGLLPLQRLCDCRTKELLKLSLLSSRQAAIESQCRTASEQGGSVRRHCWAQVSESCDKAAGKLVLETEQWYELRWSRKDVSPTGLVYIKVHSILLQGWIFNWCLWNRNITPIKLYYGLHLYKAFCLIYYSRLLYELITKAFIRWIWCQ